MNKKTICFVAGKSGGHILPCVTIAQNYKKNEDYNILFFSANTSVDKKILTNNSLIDKLIMLPFSYFSALHIFRYPVFFFHGFLSFCISFFHLLKVRPECVISTGGIVSIPICLSAYILHIPITLYELNSTPGKAIKLLAHFATSINVCFEKAKSFFPKNICKLTAYPIKFSVTDKEIIKKKIYEDLGLDPNKKTLFLFGGSQGSLLLNNYLKEWIYATHLSSDQFQIIHQTGFYDQNDWKKIYQSAHITAHVFNYNNNLAHMYTVADLILCRAGAGTLFELLFFEKKSIVIPLQTNSTSHQVDNAQEMAHTYPDLFNVLLQNECEKNMSRLFNRIDALLTSETFLLNTSHRKKVQSQY